MLYIKALHIIFVVTWFAGLFYIVRLFIYNTEAGERPEAERSILRAQFSLMIKRLWLGITWPSAILTAIFGPWMWYQYSRFGIPDWLGVKLVFVVGLFAYHWTLHRLYRQQMRGVFRYSSQKLRVWNEVATVFLIAIVMLATVKQSMSWALGLGGLIGLMAVLMAAIRIYKKMRSR